MAFVSALVVGLFVVINAAKFHMNPADTTIGALNSLYLNSNNIGLPVATYILGNPALVAPILVMQQAVFTPVALTVLDGTTHGHVSLKTIASQPLRQPLLIVSLVGILFSSITLQTGWYPIPNFIFDPISMIGDSAVPLILMAFACPPRQQRCRGDHRQRRDGTFSNVVMRSCFLLAYFVWASLEILTAASCCSSTDRAERL